MAEYVADASAVLAFALNEPAKVDLPALLARAMVASINFGEVATKLIDRGTPVDEAANLVKALEFPVVPVDLDLALAAASLRAVTRSYGLSLGDRCCLALAVREGLPALTADRDWSAIADAAGCEVILIR